MRRTLRLLFKIYMRSEVISVCLGNKTSRSVSGDDVTRQDLQEELTLTRLNVDVMSRQLTSLTSDVATLSADVRHIMSLLYTRLAVPADVTKTSVGGSPLISGILKSSSTSCTTRTPHRVEFRSQPRDLRPSSSSASLTTVNRLDDQLSVTPSRRRRQSVDMTSSRRHAHSQPSPLTVDNTRPHATATLTIPSTDL